MEDFMATKEDLQRYLNQQAREGKTEVEAFRNLLDLLNLEYPKDKEE